MSLPIVTPLPAFSGEEPDPDVIVIGAGIIGLSIALTLQLRGHRVLVVEKSEVAAGPSRGNAGAFAFSDVLPLASPGIVAQAPRWLLDPLGPLSLRPSYLPAMIPWLWKFWLASRPAAFTKSLQTQVKLMQWAAQATPRLLQAAGASDMLQQGGNLHLYEGQAAWQRSLATWELRQAHGIGFEHLHSHADISKLQPGLSKTLTHATFVPHWHTISDPLELCRRIASSFIASGGLMRQADVVRLEASSQGMRLYSAEGKQKQAPRVVLACGAWSQRLAASLGEKFPLETERGYNTSLPAGAMDLKRQLTFPDHGFVMTPIAGGVRVGGAVEFAGLDAPANFERSAAMLKKAQRFAPSLNTQGATQWMGCRPSLPDSLPAIGFAPSDKRLICAFGHGHLGLTQSAATAEIVANLLDHQAMQMDISALDPSRFNANR